MTPIRSCAAAFLATSLAAVLPARAASLQEVSSWGASGVPTTVGMSIYVPDNVAETPPILVLIHYCGGDAPAVFGQARGGGIVAAADQYGFIMVVPSAKTTEGMGRCWDVQSNATRTRDGGGDSHAIRQMVTYAVNNRGGNPDRVYATGDSSGGMMTELLLGLYPDVFKAGSAMAGMPAGCRGNNETGSGGGYSGQCAGGSVTRTPEEWGDIARAMHPGYTGHRPRVQLFHGDADTLIRYPNHTEAIKQWTNVLGLSTSPTMTDMGVLGNHQATRQYWENSCGIVVLDAFTSLGGDHGPSDALFLAQYVIPFLGLDKTGLVDPEVEQCAGNAAGAGGMGAGGMSGASGVGGAGAAGVGGLAGAAGAAGGGEGGASGTAPLAGSAGMNGGSGAGGSAGSAASGATGTAGGGAGSGGALGTSGGAPASGGSGGAGSGGSSGGAGGVTASGGAGGQGTGGALAPTPGAPEDASCACTVGRRSSPGPLTAVLALGLALWARARRRR
jgi:poly(hydroxyalkanoate) depolymerase family esterase